MGKNKKQNKQQSAATTTTTSAANVQVEASVSTSKNNKKAKKGQQQQQQHQQTHSHDVGCGGDHHDHDHDHHDHEAQEQEVNNEPQLTPEEKAEQYKVMQQNIYSNFIKDFDADEVSLAQQDVQFSEDRKRDWEKREKEENKRIEKLLRKDATDVEDLFNAFATSANKA